MDPSFWFWVSPKILQIEFVTGICNWISESSIQVWRMDSWPPCQSHIGWPLPFVGSFQSRLLNRNPTASRTPGLKRKAPEVGSPDVPGWWCDERCQAIYCNKQNQHEPSIILQYIYIYTVYRSMTYGISIFLTDI